MGGLVLKIKRRVCFVLLVKTDVDSVLIFGSQTARSGREMSILYIEKPPL